MAKLLKFQRKAYERGYKAFKSGRAVTTCRYLADQNGQQDGTINAWLMGWQDAFNDFFSKLRSD